MGATAFPDVGKGPLSSGCGTGGVIVTEVALAVAQVMVVVWPPLTVVGLAVNCVICGRTFCATCTVAVCGELFPPAPIATAV
jgi:hypothetical protein